MLPTLACVKKEKTVDYVVGFDELGGSDDFSTHILASRLSLHGLITYEGNEDYGGEGPPRQPSKGGEWCIQKCLHCHQVYSQARPYIVHQTETGSVCCKISAPKALSNLAFTSAVYH